MVGEKGTTENGKYYSKNMDLKMFVKAEDRRKQMRGQKALLEKRS